MSGCRLAPATPVMPSVVVSHCCYMPLTSLAPWLQNGLRLQIECLSEICSCSIAPPPIWPRQPYCPTPSGIASPVTNLQSFFPFFFFSFFFISGTKISAETDHRLPKYTSLCLIPLLGMVCRLLFPCRRILLSLHSLRVWRLSPVVA
jgi:hypothetical protein